MAKKTILIIDPSADSAPQALLLHKGLFYKKELPARRFSEALLPAVEDLLRVCNLDFSDLEGVVVILGKGSSSSARSAIAFANTLNYSLKISTYTSKGRINFQNIKALGFSMFKKSKNGLIKPFYEHPAFISKPAVKSD